MTTDRDAHFSVRQPDMSYIEELRDILIRTNFENACGDYACMRRRVDAAIRVLEGWPKGHSDVALAVEMWQEEVAKLDGEPPTWAHTAANDPAGLYDDSWEPRNDPIDVDELALALRDEHALADGVNPWSAAQAVLNTIRERRDPESYRRMPTKKRGVIHKRTAAEKRASLRRGT